MDKGRKFAVILTHLFITALLGGCLSLFQRRGGDQYASYQQNPYQNRNQNSYQQPYQDPYQQQPFQQLGQLQQGGVPGQKNLMQYGEKKSAYLPGSSFSGYSPGYPAKNSN